MYIYTTRFNAIAYIHIHICIMYIYTYIYNSTWLRHLKFLADFLARQSAACHSAGHQVRVVIKGLHTCIYKYVVYM